jgi:putative FmdB family regulatory protein
MPIYDYRCTRCGHEVEVSHAIGASGPESCSECGGPMKKALSAPAIHFKGSGWAKKDARSAAAPAGKAGGEGSMRGADGAATSTDAGSAPAPASSADTALAKGSTAAAGGKKPGSSGKTG